jgi:hypothetical protein
VINSTITGNTGDGGGGIYNSGTLTVTNSTISNNSAESGGNVESFGGGIYSYGGQATVTDSTISGNVAGIGGGICNSAGPNDAEPGGALTVSDSTLSGNSSYYEGGAIFSQGNTDGYGDGVTLYYSTITGNSSAGYGGGGIYNDLGQVTMYNSTVTGNTSTGNSGGGIYTINTTSPLNTLALYNSIVAGNSAVGTLYGYADVSGSAYVDNGGNLADQSSSGTSPITPGLAVLGNYGGPTQTMVPLPGSPAMCAGLAGNIAAGVTTDQRGYPNKNTSYAGYSSGGPCVDIGAVQSHYSALQFVQQPTNTVVNTAITPAPTVAVIETNANQSTNNTDAVNGISLTLVYSGGSGEISGTLTQTTAGGVATFAGLTPNTVGMGFTLSGALPILAGTTVTGTSSPFEVSTTALEPQTIPFDNPGTQTYGVAPITLPATAQPSGLTVSYTPNTPAVCTVSGNTATILNAGSCEITASQGGNSTYAPATPVEQTFTVNPAPLTAACGDAEAAQGAAIVLPAATLTGVVNGDAITAICSKTATTSSPAGTYPITPTLSDPNGRLPDYEVTLVSGTLFLYSSGAAPLMFWLSADSAVAGTPGFTLSVYGANFNSKAKVLWNGSARAMTLVSSTELQATIPSTDLKTPGTYLVTVANGAPTPAISTPEPFTVLPASPGPPVAEITGAALEPHSGGYTLTLTGMNFVSGAAVKWNGSSLSSPTYVSPTELVVTVPSSDTLPASITVTNPSEAASAPFELQQ